MSKPQRLLLDTHVFLWWKLDDPRLKTSAVDAIAGADVVFISAASAWEVAIKTSIGKLRLDVDFAAGVDAGGFKRLPVGFEHAAEIRHLAHHHNDPFDRLLIAQARVERLTLVTHDAQLRPYEVDLLWT